MKSLVLAEKPSVGREIARVLGCQQKNKHYIEGPKYVVTWAMGHLVTLAEPEDYDPKFKTWKMEDLPILPAHMKLKVMKETSHQYRAISQLVKRPDLKEMIIATDAGREGELVARWIMEMTRWKKPVKRLWISSQTDKAIEEGFNKLRPGDDYLSLFQSAVCRAEADWLIGLNVTRALTTKFNTPLAAGRVQTPTLCMLVDREKEIRAFQPVPYWTLHADFGTFQAIWRSHKKESRIFQEDMAKSIETKLQGHPPKISDVKKEEKKEPHPLAYDLTELQRDANRRYGFSAKHTSNVLQKLYEQHKLVTYPRTDSRYLSSDMKDTLKGRLTSINVGPYGPLVRPLLKKELSTSKRLIDDSKVTDHHAIIPTDEPLQLGDLNADERKLYDLIARRFISVFYPAYWYDQIKVEVLIGDEHFYATGRTVLDLGWKEVYGPEGKTDQAKEDGAEQNLPDLKKGDTLQVQQIERRRNLTEPPQRYTEAELLTKMEKHKLGTPATRADIIEKLLQTETIERQANRLFPTQKGFQLAELVADELRSPDLTAKWENELELIAKGKSDAKNFLKEIRNQTSQLVRDIHRSDAQYKPHNLTGSKCPECKENLLEVKTKRGKNLVCPNRECGYKRAAENPLLNKRCPQCRKKMELRTGKAGKFAQCKPCNVVEMLEDQKGRNKTKKREERSLIKQYSRQEELGNSLADALKAAMENKNNPS